MPQILCPQGHRFKVADRQMGEMVECPTCQSEFTASNGEDNLDSAENGKSAAKSGKRAPIYSNGKLYGYPIPFWINSVIGKPLLLFGLFIAILGRGCDATGMRSISRTDAQFQQAKVSFDLEWRAKSSAVNLKLVKKQRELTDLAKDKELKGEKLVEKQKPILEALTELGKEAEKVRSEQSMAEAENESGTWKPLREASMKAVTSYQMWSYSHELMFIFGTLVLVLGVLTIAFTGEGAERWVAYIIITIITFSIYVGGFAWVEAINTSNKSGTTTIDHGPPIGPRGPRDPRDLRDPRDP